MSQGKLETEYQIGGITITTFMPHLTFYSVSNSVFHILFNFASSYWQFLIRVDKRERERETTRPSQNIC